MLLLGVGTRLHLRAALGAARLLEDEAEDERDHRVGRHRDVLVGEAGLLEEPHAELDDGRRVAGGWSGRLASSGARFGWSSSTRR